MRQCEDCAEGRHDRCLSLLGTDRTWQSLSSLFGGVGVSECACHDASPDVHRAIRNARGAR